MQALRCLIEGSFCSFRLWEQARYQQTYWLPPKTTVIGFLGSALGLADWQLEEWYDKVLVGVVLDGWKGFAYDLWQFSKLKKSKEHETAVVVRELVFRPRYAIFFASDNLDDLMRLKAALVDPVYAPCFGRSDDLALILACELIPLRHVEKEFWLRWTLVPCDVYEEGWLLEPLTNVARPARPPRVERMPVRFKYAADGSREAEVKECTQVFNWGCKPFRPEVVWSDGERCFYLH